MSGKTVLITGCSTGGIGFSLAKEFQRRGLTVFATARHVSKMAGLSNLENVILLSLDVTSASSISSALEEVKSRTGGKLDYLINNSGQSSHAPALDVNIDDAKKIFDVNFWGVLRMIQSFIPLLIEAKGAIVNIGSIVGILYTPFGSIYNASKAAIHQFSEVLRLELAPLDVKVVTVVTGSIVTNLMANSSTPALPPTSKYLATDKGLDDLRNGVRNYKLSQPDEFAEKVVGDVLNGATGKIWRGANSSSTRWGSHLLPMSVIDNILTEGTGLDKIGKGAT